jgi:hypothetical protein
MQQSESAQEHVRRVVAPQGGRCLFFGDVQSSAELVTRLETQRERSTAHLGRGA